MGYRLRDCSAGAATVIVSSFTQLHNAYDRHHLRFSDLASVIRRMVADLWYRGGKKCTGSKTAPLFSRKDKII